MILPQCTGSPAAPGRDELVQAYLPLAWSLANKLARRLPRSFSVHDLFQIATLAMIDCADRFDASLGYSFASWARKRVWGAMVDDVRRSYGYESQRQKLALGPEFPAVAAEQGELDELIDEQRRRARAAAAIAGLQPRHRLVIERRLEGRRSAEIAHELNISVRQSNHLQATAVRQLRLTLSDCAA